MAEHAQLRWPTEFSNELSERVRALIRAVSSLGGAIGWHNPPPRSETDGWSRDVLDAVGSGDAALCTAWVDGELATSASTTCGCFSTWADRPT